MVNCCAAGGSQVSLLQFVVEQCNLPKLLDLLLDADCSIGLTPDLSGTTVLHTALAQGKWRSVQQLLDAVRRRRFSCAPGTFKEIASVFETLACHWPLDFLHFISNLPMQVLASEPVLSPCLASQSSEMTIPSNKLHLRSHSHF